MIARLRPGDYLAGLGGLAILASLVAVEGAVITTILLVIAAVMALSVPVATALRDDPALPVKLDVLAAWAVLIALVFVLVRLVGDGELLFALAALLVAFAGCWWAMRDQSRPGLKPPPDVRAMGTPPS